MTEFVIGLIRSGGYWGIFLLMVLENVVPPVPSELIMGLGGIMVARGHMDFGTLLVVGTAGTVVGNLFWYELGRWLGYKRLKPLVDRYGRWLTLDWAEVRRLEGFFRRYGGLVVFVFRMLPTFRTMISLPAGMLHMPRWQFLLWTAAGSAVWNAILAAAGLYLGTRFNELERFVGPLAVACVVGVVALYLWRVFTWKPGAHL